MKGLSWNWVVRVCIMYVQYMYNVYVHVHLLPHGYPIILQNHAYQLLSSSLGCGGLECWISPKLWPCLHGCHGYGPWDVGGQP